MGEQGLNVHPVAGRIGAEISGLALSPDLPADTIQTILSLLHRYKVIFFRGQSQLDDAGQEAFAERLGTPEAHPTLALREGTRFMLELDSVTHGRAAIWHTDGTFMPDYPMASILRAVVVPAAGGDTMWANTAQAYEDLPPELKTLADNLQTVHTNNYHQGPKPKGLGANFASTVYETQHPLVRVHPVTGERSLLLGHSAQRIVGLDSVASQRLMEIFQNQIIRPENVVRWRWAAGDVAIWDNRATQHFAIFDYGDQRRIMRRVTLKGDIPVGVDGRASQLLCPAPDGDMMAEA